MEFKNQISSITISNKNTKSKKTVIFVRNN